MIWFCEVDLIIASNNLTLRLSLETHLNNIPRLVVEESVRVTQPADCPKEDNWLLLWVRWYHVLAHFLILGLLRWGVGVVSVHIVRIISRRHF